MRKKKKIKLKGFRKPNIGQALLQTSKCKEQWREGERPQMLKSTNWGPSSLLGLFHSHGGNAFARERRLNAVEKCNQKKKPLEYPSRHSLGF
jgi:hypothetical protein